MSKITEVMTQCNKTEWGFSPSDVDLSRKLLQKFVVALPDGRCASPRVVGGQLHYYDVDTGCWPGLNPTEVQRLIQCFHGSSIKTTVTKKDGTTSDKFSYVKLSFAQIKGATGAVFNEGVYCNDAFFVDADQGLSFTNGFLRISTDGTDFIPHDPFQHAQYSVGVEFDPDATCPTLIRALEKAFSKTEDGQQCIMALQEFAGACLIGKATKYLRSIYLVGPGENGKSVIQEAIEQLMPSECVCHSAPNTWTKNYALAQLEGKLLNSVAEAPANLTAEQSALVKKIFDGCGEQVRRPYRDFTTMYSRAGHLFSANEVLAPKDSSDGFWRRFIMLRLKYNFKHDPDRMPKEDLLRMMQKERAGMLLWAAQGAVRLLRQGKYTVVPSSEKVLAEAQIDSDPVRSWIEDHCEVGEDKWESTENLWQSFRNSSWFEGTKITKDMLAKSLVNLGYVREQGKTASRARGFRGVSLKLDEVVALAQESNEFLLH